MGNVECRYCGKIFKARESHHGFCTLEHARLYEAEGKRSAFAEEKVRRFLELVADDFDRVFRKK
jgi:hypothetical protein